MVGADVGSRVYMMDENDQGYEMFKLKNREFTFTVDVSNLPCGINGALYFVSMDADGGQNEYANNNAGAKFGTGYCDAQVTSKSELPICFCNLFFVAKTVPARHQVHQRRGQLTQLELHHCHGQIRHLL